MFKSLLIKGFTAVLFVLVCLTQTTAQTFWTETFADQASSTTNWVNGGTNPGTEDWTWTNDPLAGFQDPAIAAFGGGTGYFYFNSDLNGENNAHDVTLTGVGTPVNCTGKSDVRLRFATQYIPGAATSLVQVGVSTNGTDFTYKTVLPGVPGGAIAEGIVEVDLPEADNQAQVWLSFRWVGNWEYHWKIDDLELFEYEAPSYDVTFRVNTSTITVDPAGMKIAGSFSGWSDVNMTNDGNGVWSYTGTFTEGDVLQYKFKNGPSGWEAGQAACGVDDGNGGFNRTVTVTETATLAAVCFNSCTPCVLTCDVNPDAVFCDNLDAYNTALKLGPQATWFTTWSGTEGGAEDGIVTTEQAFSAPNSFKIVSTAATGGPQDVVLDLGTETTGNYEFSWKMFIPTGKAGYYNIQNAVPIGTTPVWNLDVFFTPAGGGNVQIGQGASLALLTHPKDQWFDVKHQVDLDNNILTLWVNGVQVIRMPYTGNLGGIDFFGTDATHLYYVDNVEYIKLPAVTYNADACATGVDITGYLGQTAGVVSTAGPFDITTATLDPVNDPTTGYECFLDMGVVHGNHWFTFTGDGNTYTITSGDCGASPITDGDTQFALYTGSCGDYTPVACNDDVSATDYHSTLTFLTEPGVTYYLMVDSYNGLDGTYCLNIQQTASVDCSQGEVGLNTLANDGFLCWGANLQDIMEVDASTYTIPNLGPVAGHLWCITTEPIDPTVWPGTIPGIASTTAAADVTLVNLPNDGTTGFAAGVYYLTSVVVAGGTLIDPLVVARVFNIDPTNGCFFVGESLALTLIPELGELVAFESVTPGSTPGTISVDLTVDGGLGAALEDPSLYIYNWSNGATTASLTNVPSQVYTVTISDPTGCVAPLVITTSVGTNDPSSVKSLNITPNPTTGLVNLNLSLATAADVQIEVINTLGQTVQTIQAGKTTSLQQAIDLTNAASGTYMVRVRMDNDTAVRRVSVQH